MSIDRSVVQEVRIKPAKTSTVAVFALVFGLTALYAVLTVILSVVGLICALVGIALGIWGIRRAAEQGVTGKGVAVSGLVLSAVALVGFIAFAAGVSTFFNDEDAVQRLENQVDQLRNDLPDGG
jgi:hypothetical protein